MRIIASVTIAFLDNGKTRIISHILGIELFRVARKAGRGSLNMMNTIVADCGLARTNCYMVIN
jgi:hypothetical protein